MEKARLHYVDFLKGIAILAVVLGHTNCPALMSKYVYAWDLALFFTITGYMYNRKWDNNFGGYLKNKAKRYLIPYFVVGISILLLNQIENIVIDKRPDWFELLTHNIYGIIYSRALSEYMINCVPIWYLTCIFVCSLIFWIMLRINSHFSNDVTLMIFGIVCICLNCIIIGAEISPLPWHCDTVLFAMPFIILGYKLKNQKIEERFIEKYTFLSLLVGIIFSIINPGKVYFSQNRYGNIIFMFIGAVCSIKSFWSIAYKIRTLRILEYFGRNSLFIMCINYYIDHLFVRGLYIVGIDYYQCNWVYVLMAMILVLVLCINLKDMLKRVLFNITRKVAG